jgi:hypothetical protein
MPDSPFDVKPRLRNTRRAREYLGGISESRFWQIAHERHFRRAGTPRLRLWFTEDLDAYIDSLPVDVLSDKGSAS